jgi:hypothetical protein
LDSLSQDELHPYSNLNPPANSLSGLFGPGAAGISGANAGGMSGTRDQGGGVPFGLPGGLDLAQLLAQMQGSDVGVGAGSDILQSVTQGAFGQQTGGLGGGSFGQTQPGYVAGQTGGGGAQQAAQSQAAGSADPLAILQKVLGLAKTGIGLASPLMQDFGGLTQGDISGLTPESRAAFEQQRAGERIASPVVPDLSSFSDAQGSLGYVAGDSQPEPSFNTEFLGGMEEDVEAGGYRPGLGESTTSSDLSGADSGGAGLSGGGGSTPGTNFIGAAQGGLSGTMGLLNLLQGIQGDNPTLGVGGGLQTLGGLTGLLQSMPDLASSLGLTSGALGAVGAGVGGLGGLLGLYAGIQAQDPRAIAQSLASLYGTTAPVINSLTGTSLPTLTGLGTSALESIVPGITSILGGVTAGAGVTGAVGAGAGLGSLAGGAAGLGSAIGSGGAMAGAGITGTAGGVAGAGAGGGLAAGAAGAGAALAPVAAAMIAFSIANMLDPGSAPDISDLWTGGRLDPYLTFVPELMQNVGRQRTAFDTLTQALPYVQSQEELGQLINSYKNYTQNVTGIQFDDAIGNPYQLDAIPGVGPVTHGMATQPVDFGPQQQALQRQIDALLGVLPGQRITALYGQPGGGLEGEAYRRLWQQFRAADSSPVSYGEGTDPSAGPWQVSHLYGGPVTGVPSRERVISSTPEEWDFSQEGGPRYTPAGQQTQTEYGVYAGLGNPYTYALGQDIANAQHAGTFGQGTRWDPATGQYVNYSAGMAPPKPSDYFQQSPYWQQAQQQYQQRQIQQYLSQLLGSQPASTGLMAQMQPNAALAMPQMQPTAAMATPQTMNAQGGVTEEDALMNLLRRMAMGTGGF